MLLIDGIGALVTALLLSQVLARFESFFGMPPAVLWPLAGIAFCFALYSFASHWLGGKHAATLLKGIMAANLLYCVATSILLGVYREALTGWGLAYFIGEIIVVLCLVWVESRSLKGI